MGFRINRILLIIASGALSSPCLAYSAATLSVSQNATREVIATVSGTVPMCGVTALGDLPTFSLSGQVINVLQNIAGVMCDINTPPNAVRPYNVTLDFGRLPAGTYTINWNFPALSAAYTVTGDPGFQIGPAVTGSWFDPAQSGQGFDLQVLATAPPLLLATWYVFDPAGNATWITGTGPITGNEAVVQAAQVMGPGALFPPNFNPAEANNYYWGTLTFNFTDCNNGQVSWHSVYTNYGDGTLPINRLTMPAGLSCP